MPDQSIIPMTNSKGFFSRPEDRVGIIGTAAAVIAVVWFFGSFIMDYIIHALENGIHLLVVSVVFFGLLFILVDPKLRAMFYYLYRSFWRMVTSMFINNDPIGWMKTYKERLEQKLTLMDNNISSLNGQKNKITSDVDQNNNSIQHCMLLAAQAEKRGDKSNEVLQTHQADRLNTENNEMVKDLTKINFLLDVLNKARGVADFNIKDIGMEIASQTRRRNYSRSAKGTIACRFGESLFTAQSTGRISERTDESLRSWSRGPRG